MAPKKTKQQQEDIDQILAGVKDTRSLSVEQLGPYFIIGFFLALLPAYLYHSVFDMSFSDNAIVYLLITVASAAMITLAYRNVEQGTHTFLASTRKTGHYSHSKSQDETDRLIGQESMAWSIFLNNVVFIAAFLFLAFYVLRSVETLYNYILSVAIAAAFTWQLSNGAIRN